MALKCRVPQVLIQEAAAVTSSPCGSHGLRSSVEGGCGAGVSAFAEKCVPFFFFNKWTDELACVG